MSFTVNGSTGSVVSAASITISRSIASGHPVGFWGYSESSVSAFGTVTDSAGNTGWTNGASVNDGARLNGTAANVSLGSPITSITYTPPATATTVAGLLWDFSATGGTVSIADSAATLYNFSTTTAANGVATRTLAITTADGLLFGAAADLSSGTLTIGTGFTSDFAISSPNFGIGEHKAITTSGALTLTAAAAGDLALVAGMALQITSSGNAGSGTTLEGNDSSSGSGAQKDSGSGATNEAADASAGTGTVAGDAGSGATLEGNDASSASGSQKDSATGTTAEAADASSAAGVQTDSGSGATAEATDASSASGSQKDSATGATAEGSDNSSATGTQTDTGSGGTLEGADLSSAVGTSGSGGIGATLEGNDQSSASGSQADTGSGGTLEGADASNAAGSQSQSGSGADTEAQDASVATGTVVDAGVGADAEAHDTSSAIGSQTDTGSGANAEGADTSAASGSQVDAGAGTTQESADSSAAAGSNAQPTEITIIGEFFRSPSRDSFTVATRSGFSGTRH